MKTQQERFIALLEEMGITKNSAPGYEVMHEGDGRETVTMEDALGRAHFTFERGKFRSLCIVGNEAD